MHVITVCCCGGCSSVSVLWLYSMFVLRSVIMFVCCMCVMSLEPFVWNKASKQVYYFFGSKVWRESFTWTMSCWYCSVIFWSVVLFVCICQSRKEKISNNNNNGETYYYRIKLYEHENEWNKAVGSYDLEITANPAACLQVDLARVRCYVVILSVCR